jgi:hypothetical protein
MLLPNLLGSPLSLRGAKRRSNLGGEARRLPGTFQVPAMTKSEVPDESGKCEKLSSLV